MLVLFPPNNTMGQIVIGACTGVQEVTLICGQLQLQSLDFLVHWSWGSRLWKEVQGLYSFLDEAQLAQPCTPAL